MFCYQFLLSRNILELELVSMTMWWKQFNSNIWWCLWFPDDTRSLLKCDMKFVLWWQVMANYIVSPNREQKWHHVLIWFRNSEWNILWICEISGFDNVQLKSHSEICQKAPNPQNQTHVFSCHYLWVMFQMARQAVGEKKSILKRNTSVYCV